MLMCIVLGFISVCIPVFLLTYMCLCESQHTLLYCNRTSLPRFAIGCYGNKAQTGVAAAARHRGRKWGMGGGCLQI